MKTLDKTQERDTKMTEEVVGMVVEETEEGEVSPDDQGLDPEVETSTTAVTTTEATTETILTEMTTDLAEMTTGVEDVAEVGVETDSEVRL